MNDFEYKMEAEKTIKRLKERVAELEKDLHMALRHYDQLAHDLVLNPIPQIKELSDEEIIEIRDSCYVQSGIDEWEFDDVVFARAILKKASEK